MLMSASERIVAVNSCAAIVHGKQYDQYTAPTTDVLPCIDTESSSETLSTYPPTCDTWEFKADAQRPLDVDSRETDESALVARLATQSAGAAMDRTFRRISSVHRGLRDMMAAKAAQASGVSPCNGSSPIQVPNQIVEDDLPPRRRKFDDWGCFPEPCSIHAGLS